VVTHRRAEKRLVCLACALVALWVVPQAAADRKTVHDRADIEGALDIRSVTAGHDITRDRFAYIVRMDEAWKSQLLRDGNEIVLAFDTNFSLRGARFERSVVVRWSRGSLRALVLDGHARRVAAVPVSRPNARSVRVVVRASALGAKYGYRWVARSLFGARSTCRSRCVDHAPNWGVVVHDFFEPEVVLPGVGPIPPATTFPVAFSVRDRGGSGLNRWRLAWSPFIPLRPVPTVVLATGTTPGMHTVQATLAEGGNYTLGVLADDRAGNSGFSTIHLSLPFDEASKALNPTYSGAWSECGTSSSFQGTMRCASAGETPPSVTFTVRGSYFGLVGDPSATPTGAAAIMVDGIPIINFSWSVRSGQRAVVFSYSLDGGWHAVTVTPTAGTISIDGVFTENPFIF
jgi:hypothetical protein